MKIIINGKTVSLKGNRLTFDGIALGGNSAQPDAVEKDASGVPVAWRLFKVGDNPLTRNGENINLVLSADDMQQIQDYFTEKGVKIPVDSRHYLYHLAQQHKVDEADVLKLIPEGGGALAFGDIAARADGVWLEKADYKPLAHQLMQDGIFRYFSPVIRGLADGRLRITSVAMENEPSINNLDAIAASAEDADITNNAGNASKETTQMKKLLAAIAGLLGVNDIALGADGDADDTIIGKLNNLKTTVTGSAAFCGKVRDALSLSADAQPETIHAALAGLIAKGQAHDSLKTQVDALALAAETDKREKLINQGKADGKLSEGLIPWAQTQDSAALSAYLEKAPIMVPLNHVDRTGLKPSGDSVALTAEDRQVCALTGMSEADFLKAKSGK